MVWSGVIKFTNIFRSLLQVKKGQNLRGLPELFKDMKHIHLSPTLTLGHQGLQLPVLMKEEEKLQVNIISSHLQFGLAFCPIINANYERWFCTVSFAETTRYGCERRGKKYPSCWRNSTFAWRRRKDGGDFIIFFISFPV